MKSEKGDEHRERNFENLVNYYQEEIKRIHEGEPVSKILSNSERSTLLRSGILSKRGSGTHVKWRVSKQALNLFSTNRKQSHAKL